MAARCDFSYNTHTVVDEAVQMVVPSELTNNAVYSVRLPVLLSAVFEQLKGSPSKLIEALGREGSQALSIDSAQYPRTAAMYGKLRTPRGQAAYR